MKKLFISTILLTFPLIGTATAQTTTSTLTKLVNEQERQIQELTAEVSSLRSLLDLEHRKNGTIPTPVVTDPLISKTSSTSSHIVRTGDTYSSISREYGISVSSLIIANPSVNPNKIAINQKIVIPKANSKAVASAPKPTKKALPKAKVTKDTKNIGNTNGTYKVSQGDTFYGIARKHQITLSSLSAANPEVNPRKLKVGQTIRLSQGAIKPTDTTPIKNSRSAYKPLPEVVKNTNPNKPKSNLNHKPSTKPIDSYVKQSRDVARTVPVSHEMTFGAFAKQHGTSIAVLNTLNGLDLPADEPMAAGSELFIPNR